MKKFSVFQVMLVTLLAFVLAFTSCDNEGDGGGRLDSALFGTWIHAEDGDVWIFYQNGTFRWEWDGDLDTGIWSTNNGIITFSSGPYSISMPYGITGGRFYLDGDGPYIKQ